MSVISAASVLSHANELGGGLWNPAIRWTTKYAVFVKVTTDNGQTGLGECWCFDAAPDALAAFLSTEVLPSIVGCRLSDLDDVFDQLIARATLTSRHGILSSALSGIDIAVHDLKARAAGLPLHRYLSRSGSGSVRLYGSGGLYGDGKTVDKLVSEMVAMARQDHSIVKMKIGGLDIEADLERARAVIDALPASCSLIIDAVYSYTPAEALKVFEALPVERIEAFQSPIKPDDISGMAWLVKNGVPVMGVEAEHRPEVHSAMIDQGAVTFLQTAPVACGGIRRVQELSDEIQGTSIRLSLEVSSTAVALAAACHLAAADKTVAHVECHSVHTVFFEHLPLSPVGNTDRRSLPETAGLGFNVPEGDLDFHFEKCSRPQSRPHQGAA